VYRTPLRDTRVAIIGLTGRVPSTSFVPGLPLVDAVELAAAWAAALAERLGIRLLVIKGDTLARHRLRDPRVPADVDLLVEPAAFERYCAAIAAAGWTERAVPRINQRGAHSVTYLHDGWPCDIDVHHRYPGFLAQPSTVFVELWRLRVAQPFAHVPVPTPDRVSSLAIMALHAMRDGAVSDRHRAELDRARSAALTDAERVELAELARTTGCAGPLHDVLTDLGVDVAVEDSPELREWRARVASSSRGAYPWLLLWREASWRERPRILFRALWPTRSDMLAARPETPDRVGAVVLARAARLVRGIRGLPVGIRALRSSGAGPSVTPR
jgi:hypothetical protein